MTDRAGRRNDGQTPEPRLRFTQVHPAVFQLSVPFPGGGVALVYLIRGERLALVDTGVAWSPARHIAPAIRELGLDLSQVELIVNTHGHFDHLGGNAAVRQASGAKILMHASDAIYARSAQHHAAMARQPFEVLGLLELASQRAIFSLDLLGDSTGTDALLEEGDIVDVGGGIRLRVMHTPGHTAGSVSLYWAEERLLLTGDAVQGRGSRCGGLPLYEATGEYRRSLQRLADLPIDRLLLGHWFQWSGPLPTPIREFDEVAATIDDSYRTSVLIEDAVREARMEAEGRGVLEITRLACRKLVHHLPLQLDKATGLPSHGVPTLVTHLLEQSSADREHG